MLSHAAIRVTAFEAPDLVSNDQVEIGKNAKGQSSNVN
jgi:hypothetical protein